MKATKDGEFRSSVYTQRPPYADFDAPAKFQAIQSIIAKRLKEHPNAMCSYSGGSDSDIMIHMIETVRKIFGLPPIKYYFFETGLEMEATRRHVREMAELYGVDIQTVRPKKNIVQATREYGQPFVSKIMSAGLEAVQKKNIPLTIADEYDQAGDKAAKRKELKSRYPGCEQAINFLCCCNSAGEPRPNIQLVINSSKHMLDFIKENPIPFRVSNHCCDICKKQPAHAVEKQFDMVITGERRDEGGMRSVPRSDSATMCFTETAAGKFRLRPLYYVSDADKQWYKDYTTASGIQTLTRSTGSSERAAAAARSRQEPRPIWNSYAHMNRTSSRRHGRSSVTVTGIARSTTSIRLCGGKWRKLQSGQTIARSNCPARWFLVK